MAFNYWGKTDKGKVRKKNEDSFEGFIYNNTLFLIIADGFGITDEKNGQTAGVVAVNEIKHFIETFYIQGNVETLKFIMGQCIYLANRIICGYKKADFDEYSGFGASITIAALLPNREIVMCHMGNTRLYLLRQGQLIQCTKDHTQAQLLVDKGSITQEEYIQHPERVILTNGLGYNEEVNADIFNGVLEKEDFILLLTDGIYNMFANEDIKTLILEAGELETAVKWMIEAANERGGFDNLTALISYINF